MYALENLTSKIHLVFHFTPRSFGTKQYKTLISTLSDSTQEDKTLTNG